MKWSCKKVIFSLVGYISDTFRLSYCIPQNIYTFTNEFKMEDMPGYFSLSFALWPKLNP